MTRFVRSLPSFALSAPVIGVVAAVVGAGTALASPRSERVAARIAERAYARQAITEARAAQALDRVAQIAPLVPPPPPRPATVRRLARAGVLPPFAPPPSLGTGVAPVSVATATPPRSTGATATPAPATGAAVQQAGATAPAIGSPSAGPRAGIGSSTAPRRVAGAPAIAAPTPAPAVRLEPTPTLSDPATGAVDPAGLVPDATRSVLVIGEEAADAAPSVEPTPAQQAIETIELLPVPEPR